MYPLHTLRIVLTIMAIVQDNFIITIICISVYDLEPQKLTGVIKYIGKVDKEYVDNRIYVGVKLDEPGMYNCTCT